MKSAAVKAHLKRARNAKVGTEIIFTGFNDTDVGAKYGDRGQLSRMQEDGSWFATFNGVEWCIGCGFYWTFSDSKEFAVYNAQGASVVGGFTALEHAQHAARTMNAQVSPGQKVQPYHAA